MKRFGAVVCGLLVVLVAGCLPPAPPSDYVPPIVDSVTISPTTVAAGSTITVEVRAHDDAVAPWLATAGFFTPQDELLPKVSTSCTPFTVQSTGTNAIVGTATCTIPAFATNGTWKYVVDVKDDPTWGSQGTAIFQVVGGTDDTTGPVVESVTYDPSSTVPRNSTFWIRFRLREDHTPLVTDTFSPIAWMGGPTGEAIWCDRPATVPVSPGVVEYSLMCWTDTIDAAGTYAGQFTLLDALGNPTPIPIAVTVT